MLNLKEIEAQRDKYFEALRVNENAKREDQNRKEFYQKQEGIVSSRLKEIDFKYRLMNRKSGQDKIRARDEIKQLEKEIKSFREGIRDYSPNRQLADQSERLREVKLRVEQFEPKRYEQTIYRNKFENMMDEVNSGKKSIGQAMADAKFSIQLRRLDGSTTKGFDTYLRQNYPKIADEYLRQETKERMDLMHEMNKPKELSGLDKLKDYQNREVTREQVKQMAPEPVQKKPKEQDNGIDR